MKKKTPPKNPWAQKVIKWGETLKPSHRAPGQTSPPGKVNILPPKFTLKSDPPPKKGGN